MNQYHESSESSEGKSSTTDLLVSRVGLPLVRVAAASAAVAGVSGLDGSGEVQAAVVSWNNANLTIPATIDGLYINVETHVVGSAGSNVAGWDINPYSATSLTWFNATGTSMLRFPGVTTGSAGSLDSGTVVGSSGSYGSGAVVVGAAAGNWKLNSTNYFGFRFVASDALTHYGWGKFIIGASINGSDRMIESLHYESVAGASITVNGGSPPAVPEPATVSIFAMGAVGVLVRRHLRGRKSDQE